MVYYLEVVYQGVQGEQHTLDDGLLFVPVPVTVYLTFFLF